MFAPTLAMAQKLKMDRDILLNELRQDEIASRRLACAIGQAPAMRARIRSVGWETLSVGQWCVTVLTRAGRDSTLRFVTMKSGEATAALAFDNGFVNGYNTRETIPATAPTMMALLPMADRCLDQKEPNARLCSSAGFVLGARAARGELVPVS